MSKGKFIVIEGPDGTGKTTQVKLLIKKLERAGYKVKLEDFPQYGKKSAGPVEDYLSGQYGSAEALGAYIPSIFFAVDRFAAAARIRNHLKQGFIVVSNRYMMTNMAHQGGKIKNTSTREKYFKWLLGLEYNFFKIPKPDLQIILHLPTAVSEHLLKRRGPRFYIGSKQLDLHEKDASHLRAAEKTYLQIAKKYKYPLIEGYVNNQLLTPEQVHEQVYAIVKKRI